MNNSGFSTIELALVITFMGFLTMFTNKTTIWIKNKKLDILISEINYIIKDNKKAPIKSKFNQDTEWLIIEKEYNGEYNTFFEIARYNKDTNLFNKNDILYILKNIDKDKIYLINNGIIIEKNFIYNSKNKYDKIYGIAIKK